MGGLAICVLLACMARASLGIRAASWGLSTAASELGVGRVLRGRYVLEKQLATSSRRSFPKVSHRHNMTPGKHLGTGAFGDTWEALDREADPPRKVAIKLLFQRKGEAKRYLTWQDADFHAQLEESMYECAITKEILQSRHIYPAGARHVCECYAEHISDARGTAEVVFLVLENCGQDLRRSFVDPHRSHKTSDVGVARELMRELLEGVAFLQRLNPPIIHHDLKPANLAFNGETLKILDWGASIRATSANSMRDVVSSWNYKPPEVDEYQSFYSPAHSFDDFSAGAIYTELLCPALDPLIVQGRFSCTRAGGNGLEDLLASTCPWLNQREIENDIHMIRELVSTSTSDRPNPETLIQRAVLAPHELGLEQEGELIVEKRPPPLKRVDAGASHGMHTRKFRHSYLLDRFKTGFHDHGMDMLDS